MSFAHNAYRQSQKTSMTRIDMLIAVYDRTLKVLAAGINAISEERQEQLEIERLQACKCIVALLDGIQADRDEVAKNIQRLLLFSVRLIWSTRLEDWEAAARMIGRLHNSFMQIRDTAVELELHGKIPPLDFTAVREETLA